MGRLERALAGGIKLIQVREKEMAGEALARLAARVVKLARGAGARVLINADAALASRVGADGVHLTAAQLAHTERRPALDLVGASCHDAGELARAGELGVDFAVLGPVRPTPSHPGAPGIGWDAVAELLRDCPLPVYALGGLSPADLDAAYGCGAHGISMMRGAWK
jgi:8-oxo-dGTP diphosphatase